MVFMGTTAPALTNTGTSRCEYSALWSIGPTKVRSPCQSVQLPSGSHTSLLIEPLTGAEAASVMGAISMSSPNMYCVALWS